MNDKDMRDKILQAVMTEIKAVAAKWAQKVPLPIVDAIIVEILKIIDDGVENGERLPYFMLIPFPTDKFSEKHGWPVIPSDITNRVKSDIAGRLFDAYNRQEVTGDHLMFEDPTIPVTAPTIETNVTLSDGTIAVPVKRV